MDKASFLEALDFAIDRENAAVAFYEELTRTASFAAQKSTLAEFKAMEQGHAAKLALMKERKEIRLSKDAVVDLGTAKLLAGGERPSSAMTFQDILAAGIQREDRSGALYSDLAKAAMDPDLRSIFELLSTEEGRHKRYFEELYEMEIARDN